MSKNFLYVRHCVLRLKSGPRRFPFPKSGSSWIHEPEGEEAAAHPETDERVPEKVMLTRPPRCPACEPG
jgi:hypothetical protein